MKISKFIKQNISLLAIAGLLGFNIAALNLAPTVNAQQVKTNLCRGADLNLSGGDGCGATVCKDGSNECENKDRISSEEYSQNKVNGLVRNIVNLLSIIVGVVAVVMIIIGGFKYVTSGGDSGNISSAKNTIIYALVGLIIVALSQVIVRFVLNKLA